MSDLLAARGLGGASVDDDATIDDPRSLADKVLDHAARIDVLPQRAWPGAWGVFVGGQVVAEGLSYEAATELAASWAEWRQVIWTSDGETDA